MAKPMYDFTCSSCGVTDTIPFEPKGDVTCKDCFKAEREIRRRHAPVQRHNTRVTLPITCCKCGKNETLDHMPKGKKLDELMCSDCTAETLGSQSRWNQVRQQKRDERTRSWMVPCEDCRTPIYLNVRPSSDRVYLCESCDKDFVRSSGDALEGAQEIAGGVHKRKS